jgi:hypothetical protein
MRIIKKLSWKNSAAMAVIVMIAATICWISACKPDSGAMGGLGPKPKPDFAVVNSATKVNTVVLVNKTPTPSMLYWTVNWNVGATHLSQKFSRDSATLYFPFAGTYTLNVTLMADGNGGLDSVTKAVPVTIATNDPAACQGSAQGFLASCSQKTWTLAPVGYAEMVGPNEGDGSWWGNGGNEPTTDRICDFNDTYTFTFNAAGTFNFDNKGDFYADNYMGNSNNDCETNDKFPASQQPWGSGNFTYSVSSGGSAGLGQLTVTGLGAHVGIAKVQGDGRDDNTTAPVATSITYDILSMGHNAAGNYDTVILGTKTSYGAWTYQLRTK